MYAIRSYYVGKSFVSQVEIDLTRLQRLYHVDSESVVSALQKAAPGGEWLRWDELAAAPVSGDHNSVRYHAAQLFREAAEWRLLLLV